MIEEILSMNAIISRAGVRRVEPNSFQAGKVPMAGQKAIVTKQSTESSF